MSAGVVEVLKAARERIERGWCQGTAAIFANDGLEPTAWCAIGAISWSTKTEGTCGLAVDALKSYIDGPLSDWNDAEGRTQFDVLNLFDKAIGELS